MGKTDGIIRVAGIDEVIEGIVDCGGTLTVSIRELRHVTNESLKGIQHQVNTDTDDKPLYWEGMKDGYMQALKDFKIALK